MRNRIVPIVLLAVLPVAARAGNTKIASTASARDFLAGEGKGTALTADGRLTLGPGLSERAWPADAADAAILGAATDRDGRIWIATGGAAGRLFVAETSGAIRVAFAPAEGSVTAVAVAPDGAVVCGTTPGGAVWRVDRGGKDPAKAGAVLFETQEAAIWSLAFGPDGTLYAGTGNKGRIWRRSPAGKAELFYETQDTHVRSLAVAPDGRVLAGTSDKGLLLSIGKDGVARTLHDFGRPEVVAIALAPDGTLYAAATTGESPASAAVAAPGARPGATPSPTPTPRPEETPRGTVSVTTGPARLLPSSLPSAPATPREGATDVVEVQKDGFVEPAWTLPDETVYAMRWDDSRGGLLLGTGPKGRLYFWKARRLVLEAQTGERQVAALPAGKALTVVTMNAAGVSRAVAGAAPAGTYVSAVRDLARLSTVGRVGVEGLVPPGARVSAFSRSGNAQKPDATWSDWIPAPNAPPPGRYAQWKLELAASPKGEAPVVERVDFAYAERNARPVVENVTVLEPGAVFGRAASASSNVLSVTNPDELGIFQTLDASREGGDAPGRKMYRKFFRTVQWKGSDPNGDPLRFDVEAKRDGDAVWIPIRRDVEESFLSFDSSALPDGRWRFRVTATDKAGNPDGEALGASEESPITAIDSTPPVLKLVSLKAVGAEVEVVVEARDALSLVAKAEGAVDADRWRLLPARDGAFDSAVETVVWRVPKPANAAILTIRVVDASGNASVLALEWPRDAR